MPYTNTERLIRLKEDGVKMLKEPVDETRQMTDQERQAMININSS